MAYQVFFCYLGYIVNCHGTMPNAFRIDDYEWAILAFSERYAARSRDFHLIKQSRIFCLFPKSMQNCFVD